MSLNRLIDLISLDVQGTCASARRTESCTVQYMSRSKCAYTQVHTQVNKRVDNYLFRQFRNQPFRFMHFAFHRPRVLGKYRWRGASAGLMKRIIVHRPVMGAVE